VYSGSPVISHLFRANSTGGSEGKWGDSSSTPNLNSAVASSLNSTGAVSSQRPRNTSDPPDFLATCWRHPRNICYEDATRGNCSRGIRASPRTVRARTRTNRESDVASRGSAVTMVRSRAGRARAPVTNDKPSTMMDTAPACVESHRGVVARTGGGVVGRPVHSLLSRRRNVRQRSV